MVKEEIVAKVIRVVCHELPYGKGGIATTVTIESGESEGNEDRHVTTFEMIVEYKGRPCHMVGDRFPYLRDAALSALEIVG